MDAPRKQTNMSLLHNIYNARRSVMSVVVLAQVNLSSLPIYPERTTTLFVFSLRSMLCGVRDVHYVMAADTYTHRTDTNTHTKQNSHLCELGPSVGRSVGLVAEASIKSCCDFTMLFVAVNAVYCTEHTERHKHILPWRANARFLK